MLGRVEPAVLQSHPWSHLRPLRQGQSLQYCCLALGRLASVLGAAASPTWCQQRPCSQTALVSQAHPCGAWVPLAAVVGEQAAPPKHQVCRSAEASSSRRWGLGVQHPGLSSPHSHLCPRRSGHPVLHCCLPANPPRAAFVFAHLFLACTVLPSSPHLPRSDSSFAAKYVRGARKNCTPGHRLRSHARCPQHPGQWWPSQIDCQKQVVRTHLLLPDAPLLESGQRALSRPSRAQWLLLQQPPWQHLPPLLHVSLQHPWPQAPRVHACIHLFVFTSYVLGWYDGGSNNKPCRTTAM